MPPNTSYWEAMEDKIEGKEGSPAGGQRQSLLFPWQLCPGLCSKSWLDKELEKEANATESHCL